MFTTFHLAASGASLALVVIGWVYYLSLVPREKVPARPVGFAFVMLASILAVVGVFGAGIYQGTWPSTTAWVLGINAIGLAAFFFYLMSQAPLPDQPIRVKIGEPLPAIIAQDGKGQTHNSKEWQGQRVLFKFFRGFW